MAVIKILPVSVVAVIKILPVSGHKNKTRTHIKRLRHSSLHMNVVNVHVNFSCCNKIRKKH